MLKKIFLALSRRLSLPGQEWWRAGLRLPAGIILLSAAILYLYNLTPARFGFYHDDGIYVVTAKALATGQGYRIISLPYEPAQTKYPPFYPFLLSLIWRLRPQFPENLQPMMLLSALATIAFIGLAWCYLKKENYGTRLQALLAVGLAAINWRMAMLATSIYSEAVYAAISVAGLWLAERYERRGAGWVCGLVLGIVLGLAFLTRASGITLIVAVVSYYVLRKEYRKALLLAGIGGIFVLGWAGWCHVNRTTAENVTVAYYTSYIADFREVISDLQASSNASKLMTLLSIIGNNALMLIFIFVPVVCLGLDYVRPPSFFEGIAISIAFIFIGSGFIRHRSTGFRLLHVYVVSYLALHLLWPYTSYDRFLMPILPFLLLFLATELEVLIASLRRDLRLRGQAAQTLSAAFIGLVMLVCIGLASYNYGLGIYWSLISKRFYAGRALEDAQAIRWIKANTDPSDVLVCYRDPMYYLYTGRKAIRSFLMKEKVSAKGPEAIGERAKIIFRIVDEIGGRYLIATSSDFELEYQPDLLRKSFKALLEQNPEAFIPVFMSPEGCRIYRINTVK